MNEHQVNGGLDQGVGRVKDAAGALLGDLKTQASGKAQQVRGQAESLYGDALNQLTDIASKRPAAALAGALGIGVVLGLLLSRST